LEKRLLECKLAERTRCYVHPCTRKNIKVIKVHWL